MSEALMRYLERPGVIGEIMAAQINNVIKLIKAKPGFGILCKLKPKSGNRECFIIQAAFLHVKYCLPHIGPTPIRGRTFAPRGETLLPCIKLARQGVNSSLKLGVQCFAKKIGILQWLRRGDINSK